MKNLCALLVIAMDALFVVLYVRRIRKSQSSPALSTWIIFFLAGSLSLVTYAIAENRDFRSGIMNVADVGLAIAVLIAIFMWGKREMRFKPFEKWYLGLIAMIVAYGLLSGEAWQSNVFTQGLIAIGYAPTFHTLFKGKKNTEPISAWVCVFATGLVALYPAAVDGNMLAVIYAGRNIVLVSLLLAVMLYYELRERRKP